MDSPISAPNYSRYAAIYKHGADRYDLLVSREDVDGNLLPALASVAKIVDANIVEVGCGTGRLTRLVAPQAKSILAFDIEPNMVQVAVARTSSFSNVMVDVAPHKALPVGDAVADTAIAGWTLNHILRQASNWQLEVHAAIREMQRVIKTTGTVVILETLGVAVSEPAPPAEHLAKYYSMLEHELGFTRVTTQTDYFFHSLSEAIELVDFFFGPQLRARVEQEGLVRLPEFTGIWWRAGA